MPSEPTNISVLVATPAHSRLGSVLSWTSPIPLPVGSLVRVPLGSRHVLGVVWESEPPSLVATSKLKPIESAIEGIPSLSAHWCELVRFTARYYQRSLGEVALFALPAKLRELSAEQIARVLKKKQKQSETKSDAVLASPRVDQPPLRSLSSQQAAAIALFASQPHPTALLFGVTGSGKTEVYLRLVAKALAENPAAQILVMVPEINLTPQLESIFAERFGTDCITTLHSGMTPAQRLKNWLAAHMGQARIVLGTRMAVLASLPHLALIIVDEEHDPSYKSQDGARHSARDLAVYRAKLEKIPIQLGSATPSLESWHAVEQGRYLLIRMAERIGAGALAQVRLVDMRLQPKHTVFSTALLDAVQSRIARGEQSLIFLNRRGYAPVLTCSACDWKSECPNCSAYRVYHKLDRSLRCHHCGFNDRVPRACPQCGNLDIHGVGRGTERVEEQLAEILQSLKRPDGSAIKLLRIDADTTNRKGALEAQLAQVHAGTVDILVGTQMVTKGHDFRNISLVAALNPDGALFAGDFRAPERLFSQLMQAGGRAGRNAEQSKQSELWIQTYHPEHGVFQSLRNHDFESFAKQQLAERQSAAMPPFSFQALLRAEGKTQDQVQQFLNLMRQNAAELSDVPGVERVHIYPAIPMSMQKVARIERAQMLVESESRKALQNFLSAWMPLIQQHQERGILRWAIDVDPLQI